MRGLYSPRVKEMGVAGLGGTGRKAFLAEEQPVPVWKGEEDPGG